MRCSFALAVSGFVAAVVVLDAQDAPRPSRDDQAATWTFDDPADAPPAGFTFAAMRRTEPVPFIVRREVQNQILHHVAATEGRGYSMAIAPGEARTDSVVSVKVRLDGGSRRAGIVSRYHDERNYYVTLLDLGRGQLEMFRVFDGNHDRIEFKDDLQLDLASWHTLKVVHRDSWVYAYLAGIRVFEDHDNRNRGFAPGRSGVMATADTTASFDDLRVDRDRGHAIR